MKKLIAIISAAVIVAAMLVPAAFAAQNVYGDVTGDGKVNSSDALMILQSSVGLKKLSKNQKTAADVDGNDKVNSADALLVLNYSVGNIDVFPVEEGGEPATDHDVM